MRDSSHFLRVEKWQGRVEKVAATASSSIIFLTMLLISVDVVMRYVFNSPIPGVYNIVELLMIGIVFLAIAHVQSLREHVKVDFFTEWLSKRAQTALDIFGHLVGLFIFSIVTWQGAKLAWRSWVENDYSMGIVQVPYWPGKWAFTIGIALLCLRLITQIVSDSLYVIGKTSPPQSETGE